MKTIVYTILLLACFILVTVIFTRCITEQKDTKNESFNESVRQGEINTELASRLYTQYHAEPKSQQEKDQNLLLDYAVDHNLDVKRTDSGLYYLIKEKGDGIIPGWGYPMQVHYKGYFLNGKVFDSSYNKGRPIKFKLGQMIDGWNEALQFMPIGTKAKLLIPSHLAYGEKGFPGFVPPNTPIIFDIEIL